MTLSNNLQKTYGRYSDVDRKLCSGTLRRVDWYSYRYFGEWHALTFSVMQSEQSENGALLDGEDRGTIIRSNVGNYLPVDAA
jgi:hypothetical protein